MSSEHYLKLINTKTADIQTYTASSNVLIEENLVPIEDIAEKEEATTQRNLMQDVEENKKELEILEKAQTNTEEKSNFSKNIFKKIGDFFKNIFSFKKNSNCNTNISTENLIPIKEYDTNKINGLIDEDFRQGQIGDCVLLACVYSISNTEKGKDIIKKAISTNYDEKGNIESYSVYFRGYDKTYSISKEEFEEAKGLKEKFQNSEVNYHYSSGDDDILLLELAWVKACEDIEDLEKENIPLEGMVGPNALNGVTTYRFMKALTGAADSDSSIELLNQLSNKQIEEQIPVAMDIFETQTEFKFEDIAYPNKKEHNFYFWIDNEKKHFKLDREHTYIIEQKPSESEKGYITIKNKETGETITYDALKMVEEINCLPLNEENERKLFDCEFEKQLNSDFVMAIVGTKSVNITDKNGETINLPAMHAYGIKEFTEEYITLINPWNSSKEVCIPKEEFFKNDPYFALNGYSIEE